MAAPTDIRIAKPLMYCRRSVIAWQQGAKTQTRRLINARPPERLAVLRYVEGIWFGGEAEGDALFELKRQPYAVGDLCWIREALVRGIDDMVLYAADHLLCHKPRQQTAGLGSLQSIWNWKYKKLPAMFMPRWSCRYYARVVSVRPERLQDISDEDAVAEGTLVGLDFPPATTWYEGKSRNLYLEWWSELHRKPGTRPEDNPLVWRYALEPVDNP